ncbi:alpha/beta hydrolase [Rhodococcoides fascians A21d2]|uniref:alpha/beta fold hydrolase n=1 Tax=Rhodococcoides fascians TaxID=1828 RepID=UPI00056AC861|nr:alpha/beta hydrolase [Rhodococcus fascians]QII00318.1 alpha/beta hydrolase [Rhodococcus fascians A21d2]
MTASNSRFIDVDGVRTHVIDEGSGPPVVLLHSGEYGGCAEASWIDSIPFLAEAGYRAVAPDWLGFGRTDKLIDFANPVGRRLAHMAATLEALEIGPAAFVGNSMGGTYLARELASAEPIFAARAAVLVSGGGFVPNNAARESILDYDLTEGDMGRILQIMMHSPSPADNSDYVRWRHELSLEPGAWQCAASARLRPPNFDTAAAEFGKTDTTHYGKISVPVLVIAGANDPLRLPDYADALAEAIKDSELRVYERCGHLPNIEHSDRFNADLVSFLDRRYREDHSQCQR